MDNNKVVDLEKVVIKSLEILGMELTPGLNLPTLLLLGRLVFFPIIR